MRPAWERKMSGDELTTGGLLTRDFPSELFEIHMEDVHLLAGERLQEIGPVQSGNRRGPLLGDQALGVPAYCRCQAHLFLDLSRGSAQSLVDLVRELDGQRRHTPRSYTSADHRERSAAGTPAPTPNSAQEVPGSCSGGALPGAHRDSGRVHRDRRRPQRERTGVSVLGVKAILAYDPQHRPSTLARSPAPRVHAATKAARKAFYEIYAAFVGAFREASERLLLGDRNAPFPTGSFPPALPFVAG